MGGEALFGRFEGGEDAEPEDASWIRTFERQADGDHRAVRAELEGPEVAGKLAIELPCADGPELERAADIRHEPAAVRAEPDQRVPGDLELRLDAMPGDRLQKNDERGRAAQAELVSSAPSARRG